MKKKVLKPIQPKDYWHVALKGELQSVFYMGIYASLLGLLNLPNLNAGEDDLAAAFRSGKIRYLNGKITGEFNAKISKVLKDMGAQFDGRSKVFRIELGRLSPEVQAAISQAARSVGIMQTVMDAIIDRIPMRVNILSQAIDLEQFANVTAKHIDTQFKKNVTEVISVQPNLSAEQKIMVDEGYVRAATRPIKKDVSIQARQNIDQSTNKFADEEVIRLREEIQQWVTSGKSRKGLQDLIKARLKVSNDRAKFIARQETSLFTTELAHANYHAAGITKFIWDATMDSRTRPLHAKLDGETFKFSEPPVIDLRTQERGLPGEAFGCRCVARPIVEFN